jgi:hypothetical protein
MTETGKVLLEKKTVMIMIDTMKEIFYAPHRVYPGSLNGYRNVNKSMRKLANLELEKKI